MSNHTRFFVPRLVLAATLIATALPLQGTFVFAQASPPAAKPEDFAGTWNWMFQGKPFATMAVEVKADGVTGSITGASIHTDENGKITEAIAGTGACSIIRSSMKDGALHLVCKEEDEEIEWAVKLTSPGTAEIVASGADAPKMEPIHAEKAH